MCILVFLLACFSLFLVVSFVNKTKMDYSVKMVWAVVEITFCCFYIVGEKQRGIYRSCRGIGGWVFFGWRGSEGHRFDRFGLIRFKVVVIGRESSGEWWVRHHWLGMLRNRSNGRRLGVIFILWEKKKNTISWNSNEFLSNSSSHAPSSPSNRFFLI